MSVGFQEKIPITSKGKVMIADFAHKCWAASLASYTVKQSVAAFIGNTEKKSGKENM